MSVFRHKIAKLLSDRDDVAEAVAIDYGETGPFLVLVRPEGFCSGPELRDECADALGAAAADHVIVALMLEIPSLDDGFPEPAELLAGATTSYGYEAPATETEAALTTLWNEVLGRRRTGVLDDFLDLNANSVNAIQLVNRIDERFGVPIEITDFFETPTIRGLAAIIDAAS